MQVAIRRLLAFLVLASSVSAAGNGASSPDRVHELARARLPLRFERALEEGAFVARASGGVVRVDEGGFTLLPIRRNGTARPIRVELAGALPSEAEGFDPLPGSSHYFRGSDPSRWRTGIPGFGRVRQREVRPGIGLEFYGDGTQLEFDLLVEPGADLDDLALRYEGVDSIAIDADGSLRLETADGTLCQRPPKVLQELDGAPIEVSSRYELLEGATVAIRVGEHRRDLPLRVDPVLLVATYLGGTGFDSVYDVAVDAAGFVYLAGATTSTDFPIQNAYEPVITPFYDVFVAKLDPTLSNLVWSTYLGGTAPYDQQEGAVALGLDAAGGVYVFGSTTATDFPLQNAFQTANRGGRDAVLFALSPSGGTLVFSTYLGGAQDDVAAEMATDAAGNTFVIGSTPSSNFKTFQPLQPALLGLQDAFVAGFDPAGAPHFSTYLGGPDYDGGSAIALDPSGVLLLAGSARDGFPTTPGVFSDDTGFGFVARMDAQGSALLQSTRFAEAASALGADATGRIYLTGTTSSTSFPTTFGAWQTEHGGSFNSHALQVWVASLSDDLATQGYGTYFGSSSENDYAYDLVVDDVGEVVVAGTVIDHYGSTTEDVFAFELSPDGSAVAWSWRLGGGSEYGYALARDLAGVYHIAGQSWGGLNPTSGAFQTSYMGSADGHALQLATPASGVAHVTLRSTKVVGGNVLEGRVTLDGDAPAGGALVTLSSSDPSIASVPASVVVPAGRTTATFLVQTSPVGAPTNVTIGATWNTSDSRDLIVWLGPSWSLEYLGSLIGAESCAKAVDSNGRAAGRSRGSDIYFHAVRFNQDGTIDDLGQGEGSDINDQGQVSASFGTALRWTDGIGMEDLGTFPQGSISEARGINELGQVVGWSDGRNVQQHAFRYTDGVGMVDLGTLGGDLSEANGINDAGQVAGSSFKAGNTAWRAFRYTDGSGMIDLGVLSGFAHSYGLAINASGQVSGTLFDASYSAPRAFRWGDTTGMQDLGTLPGAAGSRGAAIDDGGRVAGMSDERVFLWSDSLGMQDVTDMVLPEELFGWEILEINDLNEKGTIAGCGFFLGNFRQESALRFVACGARWSYYGSGWPGTLGVPSLTPTGNPILGAPVTVVLSNSRGASTPGILFLGFDDANIPTNGGGTVLVTPTFVIPLLVPGTGLSMTETLPNDPALCDLSLFLQALELDPGAVGNLSFTPGVELVLGY